MKRQILKKAAQDIVLGASLDNNILCIAEKSVVAMRQIEPQLVQEMVKAGCILLENQQDIQTPSRFNSVAKWDTK